MYSALKKKKKIMITVLRVHTPAHLVLFKDIQQLLWAHFYLQKGSSPTLFEKLPKESTLKAEFQYILIDFLTFAPKKFTVNNRKPELQLKEHGC